MIGQIVVQGLLNGVFYALIAAGLTLTFGILRLLNFAHGYFMLLAMYGTFVLYDYFQFEPYVSAIIITPLIFLLGIACYYLLFKRMIGTHLLMCVQMTLGLVFVIENSLLLIFRPDAIMVPSVWTYSSLHLGETVIRVPLLIAALVAAISLSGFYWYLARTDMGRSIRATAQDPDAASLMGISIDKVRLVIFAVSVAMAGLAGSLITPVYALLPHLGLDFTFLAFVIAILGGLGNFLGAICGGIIIGFAESIGMMFLGGTYGSIVAYIIFAIVLVLRPQGLLGEV